MSSFCWNLYIIHVKQFIKASSSWVFPFFIFILQLKYNKQGIINKIKSKIHSARRNTVELKTWLRQKQLLQVFYEEDVLENFAKFTGKHPCQSLFLRNHFRDWKYGKRSVTKKHQIKGLSKDKSSVDLSNIKIVFLKD